MRSHGSGAAPAPSRAPGPPLGRVERNLRIIHGRAMGRSLRDLAGELGMSACGVRGVALRHDQEIALRRLQIQRRILETLDQAIGAQLAIAADPEHARSPDAFRNLMEIVFPPHGGAVNVAGRDVVEPAAGTANDEQRAGLEAILAIPDHEIGAKIVEMERAFRASPE